MRLTITLNPTEDEFILPINYQYPLSAVVYKIFEEGSASVAAWLHDEGFGDRTGKNLKLFNFSNISFGKYRINRGSISSRGPCSFVFSTAIETDLSDVFIKGVIRLQNLNIGNARYGARFTLSGVQLDPPPKFSVKQVFTTKTPISVSTIIEREGRKKIYYFRPDDEGFAKAIKNNLLKKYEMLKQKPYKAGIKVSIADGAKPRSKLISIKEGRPDETRIKGFLTPIFIEADPEIMQIAWDCGLGERNALGFGCLGL